MNILDGIPEERLTLEQEWRCAVDKDHEALIMHSLREAFFYARGCAQSRNLSAGEILSACYAGLSKAVKRFRPNQIRFFGYAKADIRGELCRASRTNRIVVNKTAGKVHDLEPLRDWEENEEDDDDKSVELPCKVARLENTLLPPAMPEFNAIYVREEWAKLVPLLLVVLNDKERMILELNFQGGLNLQQIANMLQFSRANVHHCKQTALKKIRNRLIDKKKFYNRD